jgi:hypothetical protein
MGYDGYFVPLSTAIVVWLASAQQICGRDVHYTALLLGIFLEICNCVLIDSRQTAVVAHC